MRSWIAFVKKSFNLYRSVWFIDDGRVFILTYGCILYKTQGIAAMSSKAYKPKDTPQLFPYLIVQDGRKAIDFYEKAFGFSLKGDPQKNDQGEIAHAEMTFGDEVAIMFAPEAACMEMGIHKKAPATLKSTSSLYLYVYCPDVDALYKQAISQGAKSTTPPMDSFWGDRMCSLIDPNGYEWSFATFIGASS